jgi:hypothetical protein
MMYKFVALCMAFALVGCGEEQSPNPKIAQDYMPSELHAICLDGVQYWYRDGNGAVLSPRLDPGIFPGTNAHVVTCNSSTKTNDAAVLGATSQM